MNVNVGNTLVGVTYSLLKGVFMIEFLDEIIRKGLNIIGIILLVIIVIFIVVFIISCIKSEITLNRQRLMHYTKLIDNTEKIYIHVKSKDKDRKKQAMYNDRKVITYGDIYNEVYDKVCEVVKNTVETYDSERKYKTELVSKRSDATLRVEIRWDIHQVPRKKVSKWYETDREVYRTSVYTDATRAYYIGDFKIEFFSQHIDFNDAIYTTKIEDAKAYFPSTKNHRLDIVYGYNRYDKIGTKCNELLDKISKLESK